METGGGFFCLVFFKHRRTLKISTIITAQENHKRTKEQQPLLHLHTHWNKPSDHYHLTPNIKLIKPTNGLYIVTYCKGVSISCFIFEVCFLDVSASSFASCLFLVLFVITCRHPKVFHQGLVSPVYLNPAPLYLPSQIFFLSPCASFPTGSFYSISILTTFRATSAALLTQF